MGRSRIHPTKTNIRIAAQTAFVDLVLKKNWIDVQFLLSRELAHPRVQWMGAIGPQHYRHYLRLERPSDVDDEVRGWMQGVVHGGELLMALPRHLPWERLTIGPTRTRIQRKP